MSSYEEKNVNERREAPVFYPSEEEFENPLKFIESIRTKAESFGICRIVPPPSWNPTFSLNLDEFEFPTRVQSIHQLYKRDAAEQSKEHWWERYIAFQLSQNKKQRTRNPILGGKELELCRLYAAVEKRGGYHEVRKNKLWKDIARCLQVHLSNGNTTYSLRNVYEKYLKDFEEKEMRRSAAKVEVSDDHGESSDSKKYEEKPSIKKIKQEHKEVDSSSTSGPLKCKSRRRRKDGRIPGNLEVLMCEHCGGGQFEDCIILCDNCPTNRTKGYHTFCCSPPYEQIPDGNFYCPDCSAKLFARQCFTPGPTMTYEEFKKYAADFEHSYRNGLSYAEIEASANELECEFWRIIESGEEAIDVLYGADLPSATHGSGFPMSSRDAYSSHPMNLNNLPRDQNSLLSLVPDDIPGVLVPWLYMGMKFSTFCWHVEDHLFYSINYLHKGAMKKWYGVSSNQAQQFESLLQSKLLKDQFLEQPDLLFHITTMVAPHTLREHGIQVCETLQKEGEFVITFPMAYHGGFNMGLNIAEAVNFAPLHWLEFRRRAAMRYVNHRKPQVLSTEELVLKAASLTSEENGSNFHGRILFEEMSKIVQEESLNRLVLWNEGIIKSMKLTLGHGLKCGDTEDVCCVICRDFLHISAVVCSSCHRPCCLRHVHHQCECSLSTRTLLYRFTVADLTDIQDKIRIDHWKESENMDLGISETRSKRKRTSVSKENYGWNRFRSFQEDWRKRAEAVLSSSDFNLPLMEKLISESMQFLWAGHDVDDLRHLHQRLKESLDWYGGLKDSVNFENQKLTIDELQRMISKYPAKSNHPALQRLKKIRKNVQDWILSAEEILHPNQDVQFGDLLDFFRRGSEMNIVLPGLETVKEKLHEVQNLQRTIESVFRDPSYEYPVPLKNLEQLKELQMKADELKTIFEEKNLLDEFLNHVDDWVIKVQSIQNEKCSIETLSNLLKEVKGASADIPELVLLRNRLKSAENWVLKAKEAMKDCQSVEEMKEILSVGKALDVDIEEMPLYEEKLEQLEWKDWVLQETTKATLTLDQLNCFLEKGKNCQASDLELYKELRSQRKHVEEMEVLSQEIVSRSQTFKLGDEKLDYESLRKLIKDSEDLGVSLINLESCKELFSKAHPVFEVIEQTIKLMKNGQALKSWELIPIIAKADTLPFTFSHLEELKRRIALAEDLAEKCTRLLTKGLQIYQLSEIRELLYMGNEFYKKNGFRIAELDVLLEWDTKLRLEWLMHILLCDVEENYTSVSGLPLDTVETSPLNALKVYFSAENLNHVNTDDGGGSSGFLEQHVYYQKSRLEAIAAILEQGKISKVNYQLFSRLDRAYAGAKSWTEYTTETLQGQRKLKPMELTHLLQMGKNNAFQLDGIEELDAVMMNYGEWTKNVTKILSLLETRRLPLDDVHALLIEISSSPIEPEPEILNKLKVVVHPGLELKDSFEKLFRYRSLEDVHSIVQKVCSVSQANHVKASGFSGCYCGQLESLESIVYCAKCNHWYHAACIPFLTKPSRRWLCPACKEETNKPSETVLQSHLKRCQMLKVSLPEEKSLELLLTEYYKWYNKALDKLKSHERSQMVDGDLENKLETDELSYIWKQALVMGVDSKEISDRALSAIKVEQYRTIIQFHLQEGGPTRFDIERCRKEEIPLHIVAKKPPLDVVKSFIEHSAKPEDPVLEDPLVTLARRAIVSVHLWESECQHLTSLLNEYAGQPIEQVPSELLRKTHEHIDKATTMKIQVNREALEHLIFQSTAYCICRQTNDMDRPMLACEEEDDCPILWFHHRCVGLNENEAPPPGYKCPHCTYRRGEVYLYKLPRGSEMELARQYGTNPAFPFSSSSDVIPSHHSANHRHDQQNHDQQDNLITPEASRIIQFTTHGMDIAKLFLEVSSKWETWSETTQLRVLEHVGDCVRKESRRIHEMQQQKHSLNNNTNNTNTNTNTSTSTNNQKQ